MAPRRGRSFLCGREEKVEESEKEGERKTLKWGKERMKKKTLSFLVLKKITNDGQRKKKVPPSLL